MAYYKLIRESPLSISPEFDSGKSVPGHLYSVEHRYSGSTGEYKEYLTPICDTLENADYIIPALIYRVQVTNSPKFKRPLPILCQVPGRSGIRIMGAPENFNFWGERRTRETYPYDAVVWQSEGFERDSKGCIIVSAANEQILTELGLKEQRSYEETRIEIVDFRPGA